ncbi:multidrug effflux MFS transporter [Flagellimonas zhangzhouensis]|uniref:MFS transporter, DHA1 family, bicyclomycin/chloramphenicol resistance protein n=1 Tax=Flagellimonas zhangzhouensis TaxID=1073328 RepID=A0A1H2R6V7_9FLAO|nr:multidrug effflux MFS transporter [Allomuricauda zhangzhouensis]SDQ60270.1 MFS transporter, DHA1 family, bicyclomycin/chloramphenicol resistance protein [Allomuricauda zhangzhouensis]SDW15101.1 MFS transporter, DHA1 family, bicyclomycin/chloramphenicol resistance protein [Allomuricauda zhangzhouensis]
MQKQNQKPNFEFVAMMAALMSIVALAIDAILPAISNIGEAINSTDPTDNQLLVTMIFLGLGVGQLFFGPISDSFGRKPVVYVGFSIFLIASVICLFAPNLEIMVIGRILQGIGLSAPRTIAISIIRDSYEGDYMAKIMSFVTAFFILVPVVAPAIGKLILDASGWQGIFYVQMFFVLVVSYWFWKRQAETLHPEYKIPFTRHVFVDGVKEFIKYRETIAFTLISGLVTGAFLVYLSSAQHIFEDQYALKEVFPYIFAGLAISIGLSTFMNGTMVMRFGMRRLSLMATIVFCLVALTYSIVFLNSPNPNIYVLVGFLSVQFFCLGFMWGNFRSIAMEPIGHIAGIGAAINGFISTVLSIPIATFIGDFVKDSVWPLFAGLAICGMVALALFLLTHLPKRKRVAAS